MAQNQPTHEIVAVAVVKMMAEKESLESSLKAGKISLSDLQKRFGVGRISIIQCLTAVGIKYEKYHKSNSDDVLTERVHALERQYHEVLETANTALALARKLREELGANP